MPKVSYLTIFQNRFRIINSLWTLHTGTIHRPKINELFYVPQRPYLVIGTLRDQIIYPDDVNDMRRKNITDERLMEILEIVNLQQIVNRENGFVFFIYLKFYLLFIK